MKKQEVIDLIVEMSATNPEMTKSIVGTAIVSAAHECNGTELNIQDIKEKAKSLLWLTEQTEANERHLAFMYEKNKIHIDRFPQSQIDVFIRDIESRRTNIKKILSDV